MGGGVFFAGCAIVSGSTNPQIGWSKNTKPVRACNDTNRPVVVQLVWVSFVPLYTYLVVSIPQYLTDSGYVMHAQDASVSTLDKGRDFVRYCCLGGRPIRWVVGRSLGQDSDMELEQEEDKI